MNVFDISNVFVEIYSYPLSFIELVAVLLGITSIWLASNENFLTWPVGIINTIIYFLIFYQIQLYSDMLLQIYFFAICIYGWLTWIRGEGKCYRDIGRLSNNQRGTVILGIIVFTAIMGTCVPLLHIYYPHFFTRPAALPYIDAFITVSSVVATCLMTRKMYECWFLWIIIDIACIFAYGMKGVIFIAGEYVLFLCLAIIGIINWSRRLE